MDYFKLLAVAFIAILFSIFSNPLFGASHVLISELVNSGDKASEVRDYGLAMMRYREAATKGDANAEFKIGNLYRFGNGVPQNFSESVKWYEKAAAKGLPEAEAMLGLSYYQGQGIQADHYVAMKWLKIAASQGNESARKYIDGIEEINSRDIKKQVISALVVLLMLGFFYWIEKIKDVHLKRKLLPWKLMAYGPVLCCAVIAAMGFPEILLFKILKFIYPTLVILGYFEFRNTLFCNNCGKRNAGFVSKKKICSECGSKLFPA